MCGIVEALLRDASASVCVVARAPTNTPTEIVRLPPVCLSSLLSLGLCWAHVFA